MEEKLRKVADDFLNRIKGKLPAEKSNKPYIIGIVGMIGSGRTLLAETLVDNLKGTVLVCANSARYLLKEAGMSWGENVYACMFHATEWLIQNGYSVAFDGNQVDKDRRTRTKELADKLDVKYYLFKIITSEATAEKYLKTKYTQPHENTFENFWPGDDADDIVQNLKDRNKDFFIIDQEEPRPEFFAEIENEGAIEEFKQKAIEITRNLEE